MGSDAPLIDIAEENLVDFETVVRTIPQYDPEHPVMISQGPSMCVFNRDDPQEVLASWLFAQFMLTNEVQIAYAQTEGYVPVTSKAQNSDVYQDYLAREGEDGDLYYHIKLKASKLLLEHTEDTFVTPVFNGSASLRDAAGAMIENVTKSVRRKETVDDAYLAELYADVNSLYRLDQKKGGSLASDGDLGPLPVEAKALLSALGVTWLCIIGYVGYGALKKRKK